jgi:hypothetical protein
MLKNIFGKLSIVCVLFTIIFTGGCANFYATAPAAGLVTGVTIGATLGCPPAGALAGLAFGTAVGYTGLKNETYKGMHETLPPKTFKGPHYIPEAETYWSENTSGQKKIWDKRDGKWRPKKEWEELYNHREAIACEIPTM